MYQESNGWETWDGIHWTHPEMPGIVFKNDPNPERYHDEDFVTE